MFLLIVTFLFICYVISRLTCGIAKNGVCLAGKVAIVTGGNSGIGYEVCLNLASRGCKVIIADKDDSTATREKIIELTDNSNIVSKNLNLASFKSIRKFASEINQEEERLDILVNNAGIGAAPQLVTEDGLDFVMQVNYFGPFLLTHLLIGLLKKSAPSRIVFTSSLLAFLGDLRNRDYVSGREVNGSIQLMNLYGDSKLATIMASDIFAKKLEKFGVTSNSLHPGLIATRIFDSLKNKTLTGYYNMSIIIMMYAKNVWEGAQTSIHLATSKNVQKTNGLYFVDCKPFFKPPQTQDEELCKKVWKISEEYVKLTDEEKI